MTKYRVRKFEKKILLCFPQPDETERVFQKDKKIGKTIIVAANKTRLVIKKKGGKERKKEGKKQFAISLRSSLKSLHAY